MDAHYDELARGIAELRTLITEQREPSRVVPCCVIPVLTLVVVAAVELLAPYADNSPMVITTVAGAMVTVILLVRSYQISARRKRELDSRAAKIGFRLVSNGYGRRFAVPMGPDALNVLKRIAYSRTSPVIRCRYCGKYIEPGQLIGTCSDCSQTYHFECMASSTRCNQCSGKLPAQAWTEPLDDDELRERFVLSEDYVADHYVRNGIPLFPPDEYEIELGNTPFRVPDDFR